jgi:hypothetical protein
LWETNHQEFERLASEEIMRHFDRLPDVLLSHIMKEICGPDFVLRRPLPRCSVCAGEIPRTDSAIGDDIHRGGGFVIGGAGLDETLYEGLICQNCRRIYCLTCHDPLQKGHDCPNCGQTLSPLFADYLRALEAEP